MLGLGKYTRTLTTTLNLYGFRKAMLKLFQKTSNKTIISIRNHISDSGNPDQYISRHRESISDVMKALDSMIDLASKADQDARQLERLIKNTLPYSIDFEHCHCLSQKLDDLHEITYDALRCYNKLLGNFRMDKDESLRDLRVAILDYAKEFRTDKRSAEFLDLVQYYLVGRSCYGGSIYGPW